MENKVCLIVIDGFGYAQSWGGNAITMARMPNWKKWWEVYSHSLLTAHGQEVGLPGNEIGNSEVGHLTIGAGRIIPQDSKRINQSIEDNSFFSNKTLISAFDRARAKGRPIHIMGLLSDGGVHASYNHLLALIKLACDQQISEVYLHLFTDGRDTDTHYAIELMDKLNTYLKAGKNSDLANKSVIRIASLSGRYYAMDRDRHWERTTLAFNALVLGKGDISNDPIKAISANYAKNKSDEFIYPTIIVDENKIPLDKIQDGDSVIYFNYRSDRMRQLSKMLTEKLPNLYLVTFVPYGFEKDSNININVTPAFPPKPVENGLTKYLSDKNIAQVHIAETEKYAHITYFFNIGMETEQKLEQRLLIPSPRVATYDLYPQMSAEEIKNKTLSSMNNPQLDFIVVNFANPDMVGHTGNFNAAVLALEYTDKVLGEIVNNRGLKWNVVITSDHGNVEEMTDPVSGEINTEHTRNPVPLIIIAPDESNKIILKERGVLSDVAPTVLDLLKLEKPQEMTGESLIVH